MKKRIIFVLLACFTLYFTACNAMDDVGDKLSDGVIQLIDKISEENNGTSDGSSNTEINPVLEEELAEAKAVLFEVPSGAEELKQFLYSMQMMRDEGLEFLGPVAAPQGAFGRLRERSRGKDTTIGHWELAGVISDQPLPTYPDGFPQEVIDAFLLESEEPVVYEDPQTLGLPYVPEGARCYDICSLNERTVYISYQWNGVDYIVAYYGTTVEKCARVVDENDEYWQYVYKIDSENNVVECTDIEEITVYGWQWWKR